MVRKLAWCTLALVTGCGLEVVGSAGSSGDVGPAAAEAGTDAGDVAITNDATGSGDSGVGTDADGGATDAGLDAPPTPCTTVISGLPTSATWSSLDNASFDVGGVTLTSGHSDGAIWFKTTLSYVGHLHVTVAFSTTLPAGQTGGDGMAVAWMDTAHAPVIGSLGQSFAFCNGSPVNVGWAVIADTKSSDLHLYDGQCNSPNPISQSVSWAGSHTFDFTIRPATIAGTVDGTIAFARTLPGGQQAAKTGWFGITAAATGGQTTHVVTSVTVESCTD
jgi:hypothetical protein